MPDTKINCGPLAQPGRALGFYLCGRDRGVKGSNLLQSTRVVENPLRPANTFLGGYPKR